jgi:hypothetical protein
MVCWSMPPALIAATVTRSFLLGCQRERAIDCPLQVAGILRPPWVF